MATDKAVREFPLEGGGPPPPRVWNHATHRNLRTSVRHAFSRSLRPGIPLDSYPLVNFVSFCSKASSHPLRSRAQSTAEKYEPFAVCEKHQPLPACVDLSGGRRASAASRKPANSSDQNNTFGPPP